MGIYLFYGIACLIICGGGVFVYRRLRYRNRIVAVISGLITSTCLVVIWPIPIHGGFIFLGEVMLDELSRQRQYAEQQQIREADVEFLQKLEQRFAGELPHKASISLTANWDALTLSSNRMAWYDRQSGLVWSESLPLSTTNPLGSVAEASRRCQNYAPQGYWSLPTEAERYQFWRANGSRYLPDKQAPALAVMVDETLRLQMPSASLASGQNNNQSENMSQQLIIRCVARGSGAPQRGYIRSDVPLTEWNRYQLSKISG